jgi:VWFA-related protein
VCTDAQDHVFIVNRRNLTDNDLDAAYQAPTVIEFDAQGNVANSWGDSGVLGSGRHACYVDYENNVWIPSNQDGVIQKFSHDGSKLLLQIGTKGVIDSSDGTLAGVALNSSHTGFFRPGSVAVDPSDGTVFIADGEEPGSNHRVAVFDRSGNFLRQWVLQRTKVEAAALALVKDSNSDDEVFVVNFNDEAFLDNPHGKDFAGNLKELEEALTRIDSRGGTAMRDAIRMSVDHVKEKAHKDKKALVVVTDGNDNVSTISLENLVKASQQSEVLIYGVGILGDEERREALRAQRALKSLAEATGGEVFFPKDLAEVERVAHQVARDMRSQYTIEYTPSNTAMDGTFRQIKIAVKAAGNPTVRSRNGYYATPDQASPAGKGRTSK